MRYFCLSNPKHLFLEVDDEEDAWHFLQQHNIDECYIYKVSEELWDGTPVPFTPGLCCINRAKSNQFYIQWAAPLPIGTEGYRDFLRSLLHAGHFN